MSEVKRRIRSMTPVYKRDSPKDPDTMVEFEECGHVVRLHSPPEKAWAPDGRICPECTAIAKEKAAI